MRNLYAHINYSRSTHERVSAAKVEVVLEDLTLYQESDYIFSIVPPRDAITTAQRIASAIIATGHLDVSSPALPKRPLYFMDLNAISPSRSREVESLFSKLIPSRTITVIDGSILGGPPKLNTENGIWYKPSIPVSGHLPGFDESYTTNVPVSWLHLSETLNLKTIGSQVGSASALKMCFASLSKGFTALAVQSFTTAHRLGVLDELKTQLRNSQPATLDRIENSLPGMPPKAYRWEEEMREIGRTFEEDGGLSADV
jgi:3-hydroxyisobutyrate dehydrogenase-like beta-hydroxyacid dehydrogenase